MSPQEINLLLTGNGNSESRDTAIGDEMFDASLMK